MATTTTPSSEQPLSLSKRLSRYFFQHPRTMLVLLLDWPGGGTVGAWTAVQLAERGAGHVVLLEAHTLGDGASSRASGMVRAQGGTETAIRLGLRSQEFYAASGDRYPLDCGFVAQGYLMPCFTEASAEDTTRRADRSTREPTRRPLPCLTRNIMMNLGAMIDRKSVV